MSKVILKGITWGHSRGITPLLATSQRFSELHPEVEIIWTKRTLQEFADYPIEKLTQLYDLLIIDHPWVGCAAATGCIVPLDNLLSEEYLSDQMKSSVGPSHQSYYYEGHQWALAIDAATPVASYRSDLLEKNNAPVPDTWQEVINLAKRGKLAVPSIPIDLLMNFYMFCTAHGNMPFADEEKMIDDETGIKAIDTMKELWSIVNKRMFTYNPITIAELMSSTDDYWYCPFSYGYSNYSRKGYAPHLLTYTDVVQFKEGKRLCSTLGGTGLSLSSFTQNKTWSIRFASWVASPDIQSTLYVENGGQPGHRAAWESETANYYCNNFFMNTLPTIDRAFMRPRYNGYLSFQDRAGTLLQEHLLETGNAEQLLRNMNELYRSSRRK
ncbi:MAG: extracellular solute-binding protein [Chitinophagaceae bacterium]|nr:MAG: extracellular solute-binding protein [Chitinophagaceae bacterium]